LCSFRIHFPLLFTFIMVYLAKGEQYCYELSTVINLVSMITRYLRGLYFLMDQCLEPNIQEDHQEIVYSLTQLWMGRGAFLTLLVWKFNSLIYSLLLTFWEFFKSSLLKIWNLNKCTGVIGVFNCQGAGSWPCLDNTNQNHVSNSAEVSGQVSPADVEYFEEVSGKLWTGDCAIYSFNKGNLFLPHFFFHRQHKDLTHSILSVPFFPLGESKGPTCF